MGEEVIAACPSKDVVIVRIGEGELEAERVEVDGSRSGPGYTDPKIKPCEKSARLANISRLHGRMRR